MNPVEVAAEALERGAPLQALALLEPLMQAGRLGPLGQLLRGQALLAAGRTEAARDALREVNSLQRDWPEAAVAFGAALAAAGALPAAIAEFQRALRLRADFPPAHQALAEVWIAAGEPDQAEAHAAALGDGAQALHEAIAVLRQQKRASAGFVKTLFDQFSADYDERMVGRLGYRAPQILLELALMTSGGRLRKAATLDLGCGTGLAAPFFSPFASSLTGVDLSPAMLAKARGLGLYAALHEADIESFLFETDVRAARVIAADVLVYLGDLDRVFAGVRRVLRPGGVFLFTVERHEGPGDFVQLPTKRWAHSEAYVKRLAEGHGFDVRGLIACTPRHNAGVPIAGLAGALARNVV